MRYPYPHHCSPIREFPFLNGMDDLDHSFRPTRTGHVDKDCTEDADSSINYGEEVGGVRTAAGRRR